MGKESMTSPTKRRHLDVMKLMMGDYIVEASVEGSDELSDFHVDFYGPKDSPYEDGFWQVHVVLPAEYPFKSPSIGFKNRIFHPNVDFRSGTICLDVINQTWSPMFDLVNIFEVFLPQLLLYPNPADPLNSEAAAMLLEDPEMYGKKVRDLVAVHAKVPSNKENPQSSIASKSKTKSVNKTKSSENGTTNKIIGAQSSGSNNSDSDGSAPNEGSVPGTRNQNQVALLGTSLESATSLDSSFSRSLNSINMSASGPNATLIPVSLTPAEVRYASTVSAFIIPKAVQIEKTSASADNVMEVDNEDSDANPEDNADDEVAFNSNCDAFDLEI